MRILGFPLHVRRGFLLFMLLIVVIYGNQFGVWLAISIAGFTVLHELGHALAARRAGAEAEISLDFLAGYASYHSPRPLGRGTQAAIALAGPVVHVTAGVIVLAIMGASVLDPASIVRDSPAAAVWWAGPVIGAFNLIPVMPLDGGNVVTSLLDVVIPGRARPFMLYASVAVTVAAAVFFAVSDEYRGFMVFLGLLLVMQLQSLFDERARHATSPFDKAMVALHDGNEKRATSILVKGLHRPGPVAVSPKTLDDSGTRHLLRLLPRPLPFGDPWNEYVLANLLIRTGDHQEAARYAAESYGRQPDPMMAATVARAAAALGDNETAVAWLRAAAETGRASNGLATVIDQAPELAAVRTRPEVVELRRVLPVPPAA